ncbi:MAG: T9SS type A sorting domain-containing protein [Melioribacteraceae bacterium]|nr:T9SS type A sorting domain-containing protein [Melioribacteraceae bacterium]MCF8356910.1 T9SS type A sorting domain-containing protein [Melioribacteraceae bacterium]MCF8396277.1 T9SS type A sorting domain-containing protein [Melioribacteraceae bacterium]MCF8420647.1 T9SS type A sorting domain-containing protein [Melioribacteraceae bacterium]
MKIISKALLFILFVYSTFQAQDWNMFSYATPNFYTVSAIDSNTVWAAGEATFMTRTTDGGNWFWWHNFGSWEIISSVHAMSATDAWMIITDGKLEVYKITDEWNAEIKYSDYSDQAPYGNMVYFWNENTGIVVGDPKSGAEIPFILRTEDGGDTWSELTSIPNCPSGTYGLTSNYSVIGDNVWFGLVGGDTTLVHPIYYSSDKGATWSTFNPPSGFGGVYQVSFMNEDVGIIDGPLDKYAHTSDGGSTWSEKSIEISGSEINPYNGYVYGSYWDNQNGEYMIARSTDYGESWSFFPNPSARWLTDFSFTADNTIWAVGYNQTLLLGKGMDGPTSIFDGDNRTQPEKFTLYQNYPNPFNPTTNFNFTIPTEMEVEIEIYNTLGKKVDEISKGVVSAGMHSFKYDASSLASGVYIYRLKAGNRYLSKKMIMLK